MKLTIEDQTTLREIKQTIKKTAPNCNQIIWEAWQTGTYPIYFLSEKQIDDLRLINLRYPDGTLKKYLQKA